MPGRLMKKKNIDMLIEIILKINIKMKPEGSFLFGLTDNHLEETSEDCFYIWQLQQDYYM